MILKRLLVHVPKISIFQMSNFPALNICFRFWFFCFWLCVSWNFCCYLSNCLCSQLFVPSCFVFCFFTSCFALFFCFLCVLHLHHINCMLFQSFLREFPLYQEIHSLIRISFFRFIPFLLVSLFFVTRNVCFIHSIYISHMESFENLYSGLRFSYLGLILPVHWYHLFVPIRYHEIFRFSRRNIV